MRADQRNVGRSRGFQQGMMGNFTVISSDSIIHTLSWLIFRKRNGRKAEETQRSWTAETRNQMLA